MNELFDNILVLVPVALLIFLRVFAEGVKKRSEKARKTETPATGATPAAPSGPEPRGRPLNATPKAASREKARPSAGKTRPARRDLLGRLRDYLAGNLDQPTGRLEPLHFEKEGTRRLGNFGTQTADSPGTAPQRKSGYKEGLPGAMEESAAVTRKPVTSFTFPDRLQRLPPLKRAIVLSEVLGKPKSME